MSSEPEKKETPDVSLSLPTGGTWSGGDIRIIASLAEKHKHELKFFFSSLNRLISAERLESYRADGVDLETAWSRYLWNMRLGEALFPTLQLVEVGLRNSMHHAFVDRFGREDWFNDYQFKLRNPERDKLQAAKDDLLALKRKYSAGAVVAELSFGFWTSLLDFDYENPRSGFICLWPSNLHAIFPHLPKGTPGNQRKMAFSSLDKIRKLRNRVFHHERIAHWKDLPQQYQSCHQVLGWLSPELQSIHASLSHFPAVHSGGHQTLMLSLGTLTPSHS